MKTHTMSEVDVQQLVPLLMIRSMDESLRFYVDGLGFRMTKKWVNEGQLQWCWLEHGGAAIMLQQLTSDRHRQAVAEQLGAGVGLNFICRDALAFYHAVTERGIVTKRPFVGNGMWVTSL